MSTIKTLNQAILSFNAVEHVTASLHMKLYWKKSADCKMKWNYETVKLISGKERRAKIGYIVFKYPNNDTDNTVTRLMGILKRYPRIVAIVGFITGRNNVVQAASFVNAIRLV